MGKSKPVSYLKQTASMRDNGTKVVCNLRDPVAVEGRQALNTEHDESLSRATVLNYVDVKHPFRLAYAPVPAWTLR
jgi:hypothetical protein